MKTAPFYTLILLAASLFMLNSCTSTTADNEEQSTTEKLEQAHPKLFLLSKGLTTDTLEKAFLDVLEKEPATQSVAVVVNASSTDEKKVKKTKKVKVQFNDMGFDTTKIALFDLLKRAPEELSRFDIIYILGGNPFLLLDEVNKSGAQSILKELAHQNKLLMGYSAGALLFGPDLTLMNHVDSLLGFNTDNLKELSCLNLYQFHIFPHYTDFTSQVPELITAIADYEARSKLPVHRINDNQGIIYQHGEMQIIGD